MTYRTLARAYDTIFIGTSMISVLEAVYQSLCGKSVLMVDQQNEMGGAWVSLDLFGLHDVENAVHYLLPDPYASDFMRDVLTWEVIPSEGKYRVFPLPFGGCWKVPYDDAPGRFVGTMKEALLRGKKSEVPLSLFRALRQALFEPRQPSYYVRGGAPEMLRKVKAILLASDVEVKYSTSIQRIHIDAESEQPVRVSAGGEDVVSNTVVFTCGSRIRSLTGAFGAFPVEEKRQRRPAVHLLVRDESPPAMLECIFTADPLIKYAHDVTRFTRESACLAGRKKVLVLAVHEHVRQSDTIYQATLDKLKRVGMVGREAVLDDQHWQDVVLPGLDAADLRRLKAAFGSAVECLITENFARGVGHHARRWATRIRFPEASAEALCS